MPHRSRLQSCVPPLGAVRVRFAPVVPSIQLEQVECKQEHSPVLATVALSVEHRQPLAVTPPSPSIRNERARSLPAAAAISGKRPDQSCPLLRTPAGSRRTMMRKLLDFADPAPGRTVGNQREKEQCSINARHAHNRGSFRAPAAGVKPQRQRLAFTLKGLNRATANFSYLHSILAAARFGGHG